MDASHKLPKAQAPDWSNAQSLRDVIHESALHDFLLESIHLDVDFCADAFMALRVPPGWLGVEAEDWTIEWPRAIFKMSNVEEFSGGGLELLNSGPAEIAEASLLTGATSSVITVKIRENHAESTCEYDQGVSIKISFSGDAAAVFFDRHGGSLVWRAA